MVGHEQRQRWDHLTAFHASNRPWPTNIMPQAVEGSSPLSQTMFYPFATSTRLLTYAWTEDEANTLEIDGYNNWAPASLPFLSHGMWHSFTDPDGSSLSTNVNNPLGYTRQLRTPAKPHDILRT